MKFMITKKNSGPVTDCSQTFKDQKEVNSVKKKEEPQQPRKLVRPRASWTLVRALAAFLPQKYTYTKNHSCE